MEIRHRRRERCGRNPLRHRHGGTKRPFERHPRKDPPKRYSHPRGNQTKSTSRRPKSSKNSSINGERCCRRHDRPGIGTREFQHQRDFRPDSGTAARGEAFYSKDTLTDKTLRFSPSGNNPAKRSCATTTRRSPLLRNAIEAYREEPTIDRISAVIYVATRLPEGHPDRTQGRETQKGRTTGPRGHRTIPRQKVFLELRQSKRELAR